jgi:hypothetical protein
VVRKMLEQLRYVPKERLVKTFECFYQQYVPLEHLKYKAMENKKRRIDLFAVFVVLSKLKYNKHQC